MSELIFIREKHQRDRDYALNGETINVQPKLVELAEDGKGAARCKELFAQYPNADKIDFFVVGAEAVTF